MSQSEPRVDPGVDQEALQRFTARADDGPVWMLNLLRFLPDGGAERYQRYMAAVAPLLERAGGRVVVGAQPQERLIGDDRWDLTLVVEYPSRGAFLGMITSEDYRGIEHLRHGALEDSVLYAMDPMAG